MLLIKTFNRYTSKREKYIYCNRRFSKINFDFNEFHLKISQLLFIFVFF